MGFFRTQQERFAVRLLTWRYQRLGAAVPDPSELRRQARRIVDDAHRIARERGQNVASIVKETVENLKNK